MADEVHQLVPPVAGKDILPLLKKVQEQNDTILAVVTTLANPFVLVKKGVIEVP